MNRYIWARQQNGFNHASMGEVVVYVRVPALTLTVGWLIQNFRYISWFLIFGTIIEIAVIANHAFQDNGLAWTRANYSEWFIEAHFALCVFYLMSLVTIALSKYQTGLRSTSTSKIVIAILLIPAMFVEAMLLSV